MNSVELAKILDELLTPVLEDVASIKKAVSDVNDQVGDADVTKAELKSFVIERASEERDRLLRDRDAFRGERGERGLPGRDGNDGKDAVNGRDGKDGINGKDGKDGLKGDSGSRGEPGLTGFMKAAESWRKREHEAGEIVTHKGATWQSRRRTSHEPGHLSNSWELIANGITDFEFEDDRISFKDANGEKRTSPSLKGDKGDTGEVPYITGPYDEKRDYAQHEGVQQDGACWYPAKAGRLGKPGKCGDWKLSAARGKTGRDGKDANPEVVKEMVVKDMMQENQTLIDLTVKQVDQFLDGVKFV